MSAGPVGAVRLGDNDRQGHVHLPPNTSLLTNREWKRASTQKRPQQQQQKEQDSIVETIGNNDKDNDDDDDDEQILQSNFKSKRASERTVGSKRHYRLYKRKRCS